MSLWIYTTALFIGIITYVTFKIFPFLKTTWLSTKAMKQFPMADYHWLLGHLAGFPGATQEMLMMVAKWTEKYPRYNVFYFGPLRPVLMLNHPETVKQLTRTTEPKGLSAGGGYKLVYPWIGDGLLISSGKKWFRNRKLLTPGFHFDILKPYVNVYNECVEKLIQVFNSKSAEAKTSMNVCPPVGLCTLDIILKCAFSTDKDVQGHGESEPYVKTVADLNKLILYRGMRLYLFFDCIFYQTKQGKHFKRCCEFSHNYATSVINERKKTISETKPNNKKYVDFLDILLLARDESGNGLTDSEIRDEVETFMFEGHDTTTSALSWLLYNLAIHEDIQNKAREEVDSVLEGRESDWILWDDLSKLPYLNMCIKESLRLYPPVYMIIRETSKPFEIDGKLLPPGSFIDIWIWNVHHNPAVWKDPFVYDPDRFLPENMKNMDSHAFIPFSAGPRNCIGQHFAMNELKVVIARILRQFKFTLDSTREVRIKPEITLRTENGIYLSFENRNL